MIRKTIIFSFFIAINALISTQLLATQSLLEELSTNEVPKQFANVSASEIYHHKERYFDIGSANRLPLLTKSGKKSSLRLLFETQIIDIPVGKVQVINASHTFVSQDFEHLGDKYQLLFTQGNSTGYGEIVGNGKHLLFEVREDGIWQIDVQKLNLFNGLYKNDTLGLPPSFNQSSDIFAATDAFNAKESQNPTVVDIMLLFTPNIQATYPSEMSFTLMNHLVAKANQSFANSDINMQLRLVRSELVNYTRPSSRDALNDIVAALDNDPNTSTDNSLTSINNWRNQSGADIVAMIRTHDLNEREVCGIALFPDTVEGVVANVSNVGISGGSNCMNTFTHEIGHNFGAGHQRFNGQSVGLQNFSGALIVPDRYNTIMSSFGTGNEDRNYKLSVFSNLTYQCGGRPCGDSQVANNARTINLIAPQNAALRESIFTDDISLPIRSLPDTDGDSVADSLDVFPFFGDETQDSDGDGVGDNTDAFPNDASETLDTDNDGIGNNQDPDDDNDGVNDASDQLPLDTRDSRDSDGDGIGDSRDALPDNFQEFADQDQDGIGDLQDTDDDNDGVPDYYQPNSLSQSNLMVVSANSSQILEFDASSGEALGVVATVAEGGFSFRSDMQVTSSQHLYFIAFSDVYRLDRQTGDVSNVIDRSALTSNFPVHLLLRSDQRLIVNNGLGTSLLEGFSFSNVGNFLVSQTINEAVWRDIETLSSSELLVASRSANQLLRVADNAGEATGNLFSSNGLDKPEHIAIGQNGQVYVTNAGSQSISSYNANGGYLGQFIPAGTGGMGMPACIAIGPEGDIYVCSTDTDQILKFNGQTGTFDSIVVDAGVAGLDKPVSIAFVGKANDELPFDGNHDSDGDGVLNLDDDLPLDPSDSVDTDGDGTGNSTDTDDDGDGMPDSFEEEFDLDPLDANDTNSDLDGDGVSNLDEFMQNTDPTVVDNSPPVVTPPVAPPPVTPSPPPSNSNSSGSLGTIGLILMLIFVMGRRGYRKKSTWE